MRSIWKGSLNFGLVNIPIELYSGINAEETIKFSLLHKKDLSQIRYARICKEEEKEVPWDEIVKGYEKDGEWIVMTDADLQKAMQPRTKSIEIMQFSDEDEIDSIYYDKPYVLEPQKGASKAYHLLVEILKKSKKVGIAKYVLHNREYIGALKHHGNLLILNQLRYDHEIAEFKKFHAPEGEKLGAKELDVAMKLINHMTSPFRPQQYHDNYTEELKEIIKHKGKGKKAPKQPAEKKPGKVLDIMSLLKASLEETEKKPVTKRRKKAG